jgi:carboxymethylenebutenolidase
LRAAGLVATARGGGILRAGAEMVEAIWGDGALIKGYLARPAEGPPRAGVIVCAGENGATEFLRGVTRRLAKDGYAGLLVDPLSRAGGTAAVPPADRVARLTADDAEAERLADLQGAAVYLADETGVDAERIGLLGFDFGGKAAWEAAQSPLFPAARAVVVYGTRPAYLSAPERLGAAVQAHYGALDRRAAADLSALDERLRRAGCVYDLRVHAGVGRAFWERWSAEATPHAAAAAAQALEAAWRETLRWFITYLVQRAPSTPSAPPPPRARPN